MAHPTTIPRRSFVFGLATGLAVSALPRLARAGNEAGPTRVLVIGGSTMVGALGGYLEKRLEKLGYNAHRKAKSSTGLARPDFFDWKKEAADLYASFRPDATVVMFGGNDGQGLRMPEDADRKWIRWEEDGWTQEYERRIAAFADTVAPNGEHLFWLGMPAMRQNKLDHRVQHMNGLYEKEMQARENGHYIETRDLLSGGTGKFTKSLAIDGKSVVVRAPDGMHLARGGALLLVDHVVPVIQEHLGTAVWVPAVARTQ